MRSTLVGCFLICGVLAGQQPASDALPEPFLRLRIASREELAGNRQMRQIWGLIEQLVQDRADDAAKQHMADFQAVWQQLRFPLELSVIAAPEAGAPDQFGFAAGLRSGNGSPSLFDALAELVPGPGTSRLELEGKELLVRQLDARTRVFETELADGRWLFFSAMSRAPQVLVPSIVSATTKFGAKTERLRSQLRGEGIEVLFSIERLLAAAPPQMRSGLTLIKTLAGSRFTGVVGRITLQADHVVGDTYFDLGRGQGALGALLPAEDQRSTLLGWVPADSREFLNVRLAMKGVVGGLRLAKTFGAPLDPVDWGAGFEALAGVDVVDLLNDHLNGEVQLLSVPTLPNEVLDPDAPTAMVMMFGSDDAAAAVREVRGLLAKFEGFELVDLPKYGASAFGVKIAGELGSFVLAVPGALWLGPADERTLALLDAALATQGKGPQPGVALKYLQLAPDDAPMLISRSNLLSEIQGRIFMREMGGMAVPGQEAQWLVDALAKQFPGQLAIMSSAVRIDADGVRVRTVW